MNEITTAEVESLGVEMLLTRRLLASGSVRAILDYSFDTMIVRIEAAMLKRRIHAEPKETVRVPATWWDAVKERWFLKRWVKYREIPTRYEIWAVCPHLPTRDQEVHRVFLEQD